MSDSKIAILTPSFHGDLRHCKLLVESLDRFLVDDYIHYIVVDRADVPLFREIQNARTEIVAKEDILPKWISPWRLPLPRKGRVVRPSLKSWPIRGWIYQQMAKLEMCHNIEQDMVIMSDSDVFLVQDLHVASLVHNGMAPLYWKPGQNDITRLDHVKWHTISNRVLGLPEPTFPQPNYISPFNIWRPSNVRAMRQKIEETCGVDWITVIARNWDFCEPIIYGAYVEAMGTEACGHRFTTENLCHSYWDLEPLNTDSLTSFMSHKPDYCYALHVQSKSSTPQSVLWDLLAA